MEFFIKREKGITTVNGCTTIEDDKFKQLIYNEFGVQLDFCTASKTLFTIGSEKKDFANALETPVIMHLKKNDLKNFLKDLVKVCKDFAAEVEQEKFEEVFIVD